jgi:hypothetical protein
LVNRITADIISMIKAKVQINFKSNFSYFDAKCVYSLEKTLTNILIERHSLTINVY